MFERLALKFVTNCFFGGVSRPQRLRLILGAAAGSLVIGWFAPAYGVSRGLGDPIVDDIVRGLFPELLADDRKSLLETLVLLLTSFRLGNTLLGLVILLFTFLFPAAKIALMFIRTMNTDNPSGFILKTRRVPIAHLGKWSMLDVLVVAVIVTSLGDFKGLVTVGIGWGLVSFCASVVLSIIAAGELQKTEEHLDEFVTL